MVIFMWSANQWSILGIEVTTDISKIKAAYAKKAKLVHPEEYPEEFQELQKAYKSAIKYAKLQNTYKTTIKNNKILSDKYISQDILEEQTISDKEIISKTEDIPQKETKIDRTVVLKSDNITSNNITKEERILNKDEISQPDNIAKEQTILNNDMILDSNNMKEEAISNKNVVLQLKDVSQKENISDKKIVLEPENIFDKKTVSSKKNITWKEIIPKHKQIVIDDEQEFVYDEISYEEKSQQCILDMICLAKNIYLINDIRCWEWFFNRDEYKELYKNDKFRLNFVETIQQIFGWTRKTLLYIQGFLKQYQKVSSRKAETNTIKWKS